jgi:DNA-binding CsgD family transcriptional regulator
MDADAQCGLVERDGELMALEAAVAAACEAAGRFVLVEGPPGIGKSVLLRAASERARAAGVDQLRARGEPLEGTYAFGVVRQLLEPALAELSPAERRAMLSGAAGEAARALHGGPGREPGNGADSVAGLHHGLYWLVAGLAERRPVLLVVDDAQWSDDPSMYFLASLARRLDDLAVTLLIAARTGSSATSAAMDRLATTPCVGLLRPQPLTPSAVGDLLEARLPDAPEPAAVRLAHSRTGGNPLLVGELIKALGDRAATVDRVAAVAPPSVARIVRAQLGVLDPAARPLAEAVAVLGEGAALREAAAVAGIELADAAGAASELIVADVFCDAPSPTFRHPLVREAVLDGLTIPLRRAMHRRAAGELRGDGAPLERIVAQLAAGEVAGEQWAVDALRAAAAQALERGGPDLAADLLLRALDEPPCVEERAAVLGQLGTAELHAGRPAGSDHLREAIRMHHDPREQAQLALTLGVELAGMQREREAATVLADGLERARAVDRDLELRLEAHLAHADRYDLGGQLMPSARLACLAATVTGDTPAERLVLAMDAALRPAADATEAATLAARVEAAWSENLVPLRAATGAVATYMYAGELARAEAFAQSLLAYARRRGLAFGHARASNMVAMVALAAGRLHDAEAALVGAIDIETYGVPRPPVALLIEILVETGRLEEAEMVLARYGADGPLPSKMLMNPLLMARARLHAALHRPNQSLDDLFELGNRYARWGLATRPVPPWRCLAATLLAVLEEPERANELADEQLVLAERWGSDHAIGVALLALGTIRQDIDVLNDSVQRLEATPFRLDHAHALVELGSAHRRRGRRAAALERLNAGMDLAHSCGATVLAERARTDVRACGARPRRLARTGPDALTAAERRVALLAADGLTNRAIAQALFLSTATVETHLRRVFRKLDISARAELADRL